MMPISIVFYRHKRVDDKCHYYEQPRIIEQRHAYLRRMRTNRQPLVYLHENWANTHDGKDCAWVERDHVTGRTLLLTALSILLSWHGHRLKVTSRPILMHSISMR